MVELLDTSDLRSDDLQGRASWNLAAGTNID